MAGMFEVDIITPRERELLQKYHSFLTSTSLGDGFHDYRIAILDGRRNRQPCSVTPSIAPDEQALPSEPRICHILSNGVHVHQYDGTEARRTLRIIEVQLSDHVQTAISAE